MSTGPEQAKRIVEALWDVTPTRAWLLLYIEPDGMPASPSTLPMDLQIVLVTQVQESFARGLQVEVVRAEMATPNGKGESWAPSKK